MIDIRELLEKGQAVQDAVHKEQEEAKKGNLRGGSPGVIGTDDKIYGECHRIALARMLGMDKEHESNRAIMFDAGNAAEDSWAAKLIAAGATIRREDEIPVVLEIAGKKITGRPDIVIGYERKQHGTITINADTGESHMSDYETVFVPTMGIENKGIYSANSGTRVALFGTPDPKHLAQAALYSMALNIPYALCYTNANVLDVPYWARKQFGGIKKLQPFYRIFYLRWNGEALQYRDEQRTNWVDTVYTKQGLLDYYAMIAEMEQTKDLGKRPDGGYAHGEPLPYERCDYCEFKTACDRHEDDYDAWLQALRETNGKEENGAA